MVTDATPSLDLKTRLARGLPAIGAWSTVPSPHLAEAMASCGFHWLAVDMEHSPIGVTEAVGLFQAAERRGVAPLARLPSADPYLARRLLDGGAHGVIVPVVEDAQAFADFARHLRYPGAGGRRGMGLSRANDWGDNFDGYQRDFAPVLVPQIETRKGVAAADAIAALDCVDALFIGPFDLSSDMGTPGQFDTDDMRAAMAQLRAACHRHGKAAGIHQIGADHQALRQKLDEGFRFVAFATDVTSMRAALGRPKDVAEAWAAIP